jgi:hypothetical protein
MSIIKQKLLNAIPTHRNLSVFVIGLAITMAVITAIGMLGQVHTVCASNGSISQYNRQDQSGGNGSISQCNRQDQSVGHGSISQMNRQDQSG